MNDYDEESPDKDDTKININLNDYDGYQDEDFGKIVIPIEGN